LVELWIWDVQKNYEKVSEWFGNLKINRKILNECKIIKKISEN
jgi:hypothetical protein